MRFESTTRYNLLMLRGVLFDLGSTLIHSPHDNNWAVILNRMRTDLLAELQAGGCEVDAGAFHARFAERVREFDAQRQTDWVEVTAGYILAATLEELGAPPPSPELLASALAAYYAYSETTWQPVAGLHATLDALRAAGLRLGLISNAGDGENVARLLRAAGLAGVFEPELVSARVGLRKPNPAIFQMALAAWPNVPADEVVMVGDSLGADILGAQLAGMRNVWVTEHAGQIANAAHRGNIIPEREIGRLEELVGVVEEWSV
jgi:HAD superfamily hydrolase (TIGR01509 family)